MRTYPPNEIMTSAKSQTKSHLSARASRYFQAPSITVDARGKRVDKYFLQNDDFWRIEVTRQLRSVKKPRYGACRRGSGSSSSSLLGSDKGDPPTPSAATRVQASRIRRRLLLTAKASRRPGCRKIREMGTPAKLRAPRTKCGKTTFTETKGRRD